MKWSPLGLGFEDGLAWSVSKTGLLGRKVHLCAAYFPQSITCTQSAVQAPSLARLCRHTSVPLHMLFSCCHTVLSSKTHPKYVPKVSSFSPPT